MTDTRTYTQARYDADSDVDDEQMTHYDPLAELHARIAEAVTLRQQLAEAMTMCAQLEAELEDTKHLRDAWKAEAMEARVERAQLVEKVNILGDMQAANVRFMLAALQKWQAEMDALRAERDEAVKRADDAVASLDAYSAAKARLRGLGWWC